MVSVELFNNIMILYMLTAQGQEYNKCQKDCLWKQRPHYGLENGSLGFIDS